MKKQFLALLNGLIILSVACSFSSMPWENIIQPTEEPAKLLFTIGVHIEPFGSQVSQMVSGDDAVKKKNDRLDYHNVHLYDHHVQNLYSLADLVESHGGRLTIQVQSPFTTITYDDENTVLKDLSARGHEMALHFHEDAHLGKNANELDPEIWCAVMQEEMVFISQASAVDMEDIRYWSGGNLYTHLLEAVSCAGLDINSDWKNPDTQTTELALVGVNPWRPAGSTTGTDVSLFAKHDENGNAVFLPEGSYDREGFAGKSRTIEMGGEEAYFDYLEETLLNSLENADADKVNVFHFTVHGGEFVGEPENPYAFLDEWLTMIIDPLVASGQVQWATFSEMADAFIDWESRHPGDDARAQTKQFEVCFFSENEKKMS